MSRVAIEITIILFLLLLNGVFAMSEMAVVSARRARLQDQANRGSKGAKRALALAAAPDHFLSTVQIGITLVGVLAGAFGGQTIASLLSDQVRKVELLAPYADAIGLGLVVLAITYLSLVIGELVPKRIALQNPEGIAARVAGPMSFLSKLASPLVRVLSASTTLVIRLIGLRAAGETPVSEEEIRILIGEGTEAGVFDLREQEMVESIFRLDDRHISSLMTPHTEIVWLDVDDPPETVRAKLTGCEFSTVPLVRGSLDNLVGMVRAVDVAGQLLASEPLNLEKVARPVRFVPETATVSRLVEQLRLSAEHSVLVIDEHGGVQGLVTEHDILEAIVGDLPSDQDLSEPQAVRREDGSWLLDGLMTIDEVREVLESGPLPGEERGTFETLGGFVMDRLGAIPSTGAHFTWSRFRFEVVDMDGHRVDKILVTTSSGTNSTDPASNL
ncbi:MAG: hemolysin family protein [Chloroflexota bacterium]|jgi:putative hemolysin|nr:hemolysin family protein [Aggregatilineaceae bacterium]